MDELDSSVELLLALWWTSFIVCIGVHSVNKLGTSITQLELHFAVTWSCAVVTL